MSMMVLTKIRASIDTEVIDFKNLLVAHNKHNN